MNRRTKIIVGLVAIMAMVAPLVPVPQAQALSIVPPNEGQLVGVCWDNAVHLFWGSHPNANSNSLQKGDMYPSDPNNFWGWVVQGHSANSYVDNNITPGVQYTYRVKYRPELPSNEVKVTCPVINPTPYPTPYPPYPTPTPYGSLECSPSYQTVDSGDWVTFQAHHSNQYPYHQLTWRAVGGQPSSGTGTTFGTRFYTDSIHETRRVTVSDGYRTATCSVRVEGEDREEDLQLSPTRKTVDHGELITFRASGGTGDYHWETTNPNGDYGADGSFWGLRFDNPSNRTKTYTVTVRSGNQTERATITVRPRDHYTPTPYPTPQGQLQCYPSTVSAVSGEEVVLRAWGGNGQYTWTNDFANPRTLYGAHYSTRIYNNTNSVRSYTVTLTSNWETAYCQITVAPRSYQTPYPTPTWTPLPSPQYSDDLSLSQSGRNVSDGQITLTSHVNAGDNDTVQISLDVRNTAGKRLRDVRLTDILPSGFRYIWNSTTRDGQVIGDGITSSGINLGTLESGETTTIRFSVMIDSQIVPNYGSRTVYNTAQVRADDTDTEISRLPIVLGDDNSTVGVLGTASAVQTGTGDTALVALAVALAVTGLYALYAGSAHFERRYALAGLQKHQRDKHRLNFARLS